MQSGVDRRCRGARLRGGGEAPLGAPVPANTADKEFSPETQECTISKCVGPSRHTGRAGSSFGLSELCVGSSIDIRESRKYTHSPHPTAAHLVASRTNFLSLTAASLLRSDHSLRPNVGSVRAMGGCLVGPDGWEEESTLEALSEQQDWDDASHTDRWGSTRPSSTATTRSRRRTRCQGVSKQLQPPLARQHQ